MPVQKKSGNLLKALRICYIYVEKLITTIQMEGMIY